MNKLISNFRNCLQITYREYYSFDRDKDFPIALSTFTVDVLKSEVAHFGRKQKIEGQFAHLLNQQGLLSTLMIFDSEKKKNYRPK